MRLLYKCFVTYCCILITFLSCDRYDYCVQDMTMVEPVFLRYISEKESKDVDIRGESYTIVEYKLSSKEPPLNPISRIPQLIITEKGTCLAVYENRDTIGDIGGIDIVLARKEKNSETWRLSKIWKNDNNHGRSMNPTFLEDKKNHRLYLFVCHFSDPTKVSTDHTTNEVDFVYKFSDDDGLTWSSEISLRELWDTSQYIACIPSTTKGIITNEEYVLIPAMFIKDQEWHGGLLIIEDGRWRFSSITPNIGDCEPTVYIDNEGRIVLDCRTSEQIRRRYYYEFKDDRYIEAPLPVMPCNVSISAEVVNDNGIFYMGYPDSRRNDRDNISLYVSVNGVDWIWAYHMMEGYADYGYSGIALSDSQLMVVYETSEGIYVQDISNCREIIRSLVSK